MNDDRQLQAALAAFLALATAFLGVSTWRDGLSSHRPPVDLQSLSAGVGAEDVLARLWEDPITAVHAAVREHQGQLFNHEPKSLASEVRKRARAGNVSILAIMVDGTPFAEDVESRLRLRYAVAAALVEEGFRPRERTTIGFVHRPWPRTICQPPDAGGVEVRAGGWLVLPPLPVLDVELSLSVPLRPERRVVSDDGGGSSEPSLLVPYEWWIPPSVSPPDRPARDGLTLVSANPGTTQPCADGISAGLPDVLVLWLPEEEFADRPLARLRMLLGDVLDEVPESRVDVALIGPRSSDTLQQMPSGCEQMACGSEQMACRPEFEKACALPIRRLHLISPSATARHVVDAAFHAGAPDDRAAYPPIAQAAREIFKPGSCDPTSVASGRPPDVMASNLVRSDDELALALVDELERRGIDVRGGERSAHRIVLLSEADTIYGRALPRAFAAAAAAESTSDRDRGLRMIRAKYAEQAPPTSNILRYSYLRGLDGRTARASTEKKGEEKKESSVEDTIRRAVSPVGQAAEGEIQFDYIERLARELKERDDAWAADSPMFDRAGIRAIGILGSDPYDKLVILQALRPRFPEAVFFTTELDGRLWDGESRRLTHNLIVASGFDPFHPQRGHAGPAPCRVGFPQPEFPPFRDSAQAGLFHAVRLAVAPSRTPEVPGPPVLYEVGRTRPVKLLGPGERGAMGRLLNDVQWIGLILLFAGSGGLWALWTRQEGKRIPSPICPRPAPQSVACTIADLEARAAALKLYYGGLMVAALLVWMGVIRRLSNQPGGEPLALGQGVSVWPTEFVRVAIVLLVAGLVWWAWLHHKTYRLVAWRDFFAPTESATTQAPDFRNGGPSNEEAPADWVRAESVFWEYVREARLSQRLLRTTAASLVYLLFGFGVFFLWGTPVRPTRGDATWWIDLVCLFSAILAFNFLTFYVLDTTLVTRRLLKRLAEKRTKWPDWVVRREADRLGLEDVPAAPATGTGPPLPEAMEGLIDVRYAARHTADLGGRLYLPFLVMLLMVVSRSRIFDNWGWPPSLIVINVCGLLLVLACAFLLRRTARQVRTGALDHLTPHIVAARGRAGAGRPSASDLESIRDAITAIQGGAYAELRYDPAVLSLLIPTGGYGLFILVWEFVLGVW